MFAIKNSNRFGQLVLLFSWTSLVVIQYKSHFKTFAALQLQFTLYPFISHLFFETAVAQLVLPTVHFEGVCVCWVEEKGENKPLSTRPLIVHLANITNEVFASVQFKRTIYVSLPKFFIYLSIYVFMCILVG